ncbi:MAG: hypothetical protein IJX13_08625 [Clostridia bacterium]|nr:hypothetical protein [Clostridia bacterium]
MANESKKQFSLSLLMRIFLGLIVLVSIGVFANSVMYYNQLNREAEELKSTLNELYEVRDELTEMLGSAEALNRLLTDYAECKEILESGTLEGDLLAEYQMHMASIREMLNSSKNKDYITKVAKNELGLYFADEEIFYNDIND